METNSKLVFSGLILILSCYIFLKWKFRQNIRSVEKDLISLAILQHPPPQILKMEDLNLTKVLPEISDVNCVCLSFKNNFLTTDSFDEAEKGGLTFRRLTRLERLNLSSNILTSLPRVLSTLPKSLICLDLNANHLLSLNSPSLTNLNHLAFMNVSINQLTDIPPHMAKLQFLRRIDLSSNYIREFPGELCNLSNLEKLNLEKNHLESLPPEFGFLSGLNLLDLSHNRLTELPESFSKLENLVRISVSYNQLKNADILFSGTFVRLQNLEISNNNISTLPEEIMPFMKLNRLDFRQNPIQNLPTVFYERLMELSELKLDGTLLLDIKGIEKLTQLTHLFLRNTKITKIPEKISKLGELTYLELRENPHLSTLPRSLHTASFHVLHNVPIPIAERFFLSTIIGAETKKILRTLGITHIVQTDNRPTAFPEMVFYFKIPLNESQPPLDRVVMDNILDWMDSAARKGGRVLVCGKEVENNFGVCGAVLVAFLTKTRNFSVISAINWVQQCGCRLSLSHLWISWLRSKYDS